jgi:ectoine hydroxylase-related dioxygenase (phytanoyl-CoA dioxygenase family)
VTILDPRQVSEFSTNGFVVTPGLLSSEELDHYAEAVDAAVTQRTLDDQRTLAEKPAYEQSFIQCMRLWETDPAVAPLTFHPALAQAATELLGVESVLLWQDQALYKEPGGRITDPHQDAPLWPIGDAPLVSAWIPFDGSTEADGALGYVPGSHLAGALDVVDLMNDPCDILSDPALAGVGPQRVEVPRGSILWHHGMTVHEAAANRSDRKELNRPGFDGGSAYWFPTPVGEGSLAA